MHKGKTGLLGELELERYCVVAEGGDGSLNLPKAKLVVREEEEKVEANEGFSRCLLNLQSQPFVVASESSSSSRSVVYIIILSSSYCYFSNNNMAYILRHGCSNKLQEEEEEEEELITQIYGLVE